MFLDHREEASGVFSITKASTTARSVSLSMMVLLKERKLGYLFKFGPAGFLLSHCWLNLLHHVVHFIRVSLHRSCPGRNLVVQ
jgi:hypothetical protein